MKYRFIIHLGIDLRTVLYCCSIYRYSVWTKEYILGSHCSTCT